MTESMATAIFRFIGLIVIFGLLWLLVWSGSASIWWLFYSVAALFGLMGLGVLFACLYAGAEREMRDPHRPRANGIAPIAPPRTPPAGGSGTSRAQR